jgi:hypothetical protein
MAVVEDELHLPAHPDNIYLTYEMSMFSETSTGMIDSHMRITSVSRDLPFKRNNLNR